MTKTSQFQKILWRVVKFGGIAIALVLLVFTIISWIVFEKKNTWLLEQIQSHLDEVQSGQLEVESINLKLLKNFPDVTLELRGINYFEHRDTLRVSGEKPILHAAHLFVAIELLPLINDEVNVSDINLSDAELNIIEHRKGVLNIELALAHPSKQAHKIAIPPKKTTTPGTKPVKPKPAPAVKVKPAVYIDLQSVSVDDVQIKWHAFNAPDTSIVTMEMMEAELVNDGNTIQASLSSSNQIQALHINGYPVLSGILKLDSDVQYDLQQQQLTIKETTIHYDVFSANITGTYAFKKNQMLDLQVDASTNDLELLSAILQPEVIQENPDLLKQGDLYIRGRVFGELKNKQPQFDIAFGVKKLTLKLPGSRGTFQHVGFDGRLISGRAIDYSEAVFEVKNLTGQVPGGFVKGQFIMTNFVEPSLDYNLEAKLNLDGYDQVFKIKHLKSLRGTIALLANFQGPLKSFTTHKMDSSRSSSLVLDNVSFVVTKTNQPVSGLSGRIENRFNRATIQQLALQYGRNDLTVNGSVDNLVYFLIKGESEINAVGNLKSRQCFTKDFIVDTLQTAAVQDRITNLNIDFQLNTKASSKANSVMPDISFDISNLSATLDKLADIKTLKAQGVLMNTDGGLKLTLADLRATLQNGKVQVSGDLLVPQWRIWKFNSRVTMEKFPWDYISDLAAEIQTNKEPAAKKLPLSKMTTVTGTVDLSADIITYPFDFTKLIVRNSTINYRMPDATSISVKSLDMNLDQLAFKHPQNSGELTGLKSTNGTIRLKRLSVPGLNPADVEMNVSGTDDLLNVKFTRYSQKAKREGGDLAIDISKKEIVYHLRYLVEDADLEFLIKKFYRNKLMKGSIDYGVDLHSHGARWNAVKQNLAGSIEIKGEQLNLYGLDVDKALKKIEESQNFNLTDVGAVVIAGPLGLVVTKGSDLVSLTTISFDSSQHTTVQTLYAKWYLENSRINTEDVAFATRNNRIAFMGQIDFANDSIPGLTIAVVDKNGCSLMDQKLYGKIGSLQHGKLNIAKTLLGSVINFVNAVVGKDCKPVYNGSVKPVSEK